VVLLQKCSKIPFNALFWGKNGGTSFHHQSWFSVRNHHPWKHAAEATPMTHSWMPFWACQQSRNPMTTKYPASQSLFHLQHSTVFNAKLHYDYPVTLLSSVMSISTFCLSYSMVAVLSQLLLGRPVMSLLQYFKRSTQSHRRVGIAQSV
jgi:hypothetical protein